jgi:hypothetical protein
MGRGGRRRHPEPADSRARGQGGQPGRRRRVHLLQPIPRARPSATSATVSEVADAIADLRRRLDAQGRASDAFDIQLQAPAADFADPSLSIPERQEILRQLAAAGVTHVLAFLPHGDQETVLRFIERDGAQFVQGLPTSPARTQPER